MTDKDYTAISIFMDGVFCGSGSLSGNMEDGYEIKDCGAQFCDDADASEDVYGDIEEAINLGEKSVTVKLDGVKRSITWSIVEPVIVEPVMRIINANKFGRSWEPLRLLAEAHSTGREFRVRECTTNRVPEGWTAEETAATEDQNNYPGLEFSDETQPEPIEAILRRCC